MAGDDQSMTVKLPKIIATSVVRGSRRGGSHGGVYMVDFEKQEVEHYFNWNTSEIDFEGRSGDRGLRGIAFSDEDILIAGSDELFRYDRSFKIKTVSKNQYLDDCQEICIFEQTIFLASAGFDSLLAFDLDTKQYTWGFHLLKQYDQWAGHTFDPRSHMGPRPVNEYHINMVHVDSTGIYFSGSRTNALLHLDSQMQVSEICSLPAGVHNARPYRNGVLFNDSESDCVRYVGRDGKDLAFKIVTYDEADIEFADMDDSELLRQGFGRGLCPVGDRFVAGGSSPSTISLYDFETNQTVGSVNLTMDVRNAIHGLEPWPFDD
jgi:WD40 repeat protein